MKRKGISLILVLSLMFVGCKPISSSQNTNQGTQPIENAKEQKVKAEDLLKPMKTALEQKRSFEIREEFELELSGDLNPAYAKSYSNLKYIIYKNGYKVLGEQGTARDAGSNDKTSDYSLYAEADKEKAIKVQTNISGTWNRSVLDKEERDALDHVLQFYNIADNAERCEYIETVQIDGKDVYVLQYKLKPQEIEEKFNILEKVSVSRKMLEEEQLKELFDTLEMVQSLYIDVETNLPIKLETDFVPLETKILEMANLDLEVTKAISVAEIDSYDEFEELDVPQGAQEEYDGKKESE